MKKAMLIILLFFSVRYAMGQSDTSELKEIFTVLYSEYSLSVNRTVVYDENTKDLYGFGIGMYHNFMKDKWLNVLIGLEYNRTSQHKEYIYEGHTESYSDVTINMNTISFPAEVRFNVGKKVKWFLALGAYFELPAYVGMIGTQHIAYYQDSTFTFKTTEYKGSYSGKYAWNYGVSCGTGLKIPINKHELIIKPDFKWGVRDFGDINETYNRYIRFMVGFSL